MKLIDQDERPAKLIVNRRAISAGIAALLGVPTAAAATLRELTNAPLSFDATAFSGMVKDGLFLPDYRLPMARVVFEDGGTTAWHHWPCLRRRRGIAYSDHKHTPTRDVRAVALEACAPDKNGNPRYSLLDIG